MVSIREWLLDRANQELFCFNKVDFDHETDEILEGYVESDDPVSEDAHRKECWQLMHAWQRDREYLASLNLHKIIARQVRNTCRKASTSPSIKSWVELGLESTRLDGPQLATEIEDAIRAAWKVRAPWREDAVPKFSEELSFESLDKFHLGLENIIGYPPTNEAFLDLMKREHEQGELFQDQQGRHFDPKVEWNIVMGSKSRNITGADCKPTFEIKKRDIGKPLDFYGEKAKRMFSDACAFGENDKALVEAEVAALRLWTGPMHKMYAEVLRNPTKPSGPYVTTLHALNSGITKLARIWQLPASRKVYRGYRNLSLKVLKKDAFQCVGGVEKSVLATSEDFNIAVQYSGDGAFILEMDVGQVNRGADVSWVSQFPHEQEILFNALSNVEFIGSSQLRFVEGCGTILVYQVSLSANVKSKTLDEFVDLRKDLHLNLVDVLSQEVRRMIYLRGENSIYSLITSLCTECRSQCDYIVKHASEADVGIFNNGAPEYVTLVKDAILLQSRALEIIDLALHWFKTGKVDPSKLDRLQAWQLDALRIAFRSGEVPKNWSIVLEQVRDISSCFTTESLDLGVIHQPETACRVAKLLTLNPNLNDLKVQVASGTAEVWEQVFKHLCPDRPRLHINGVFLAEYGAVNTLQQLELRNLDIQMSDMIAPALQFHAPSALTSLGLRGSPIGCTGAESLGRALSNLQKLRHVDLSSCNIADRGCTAISRGLPALTELEGLDLAHNNVKDDGFKILANAVRTVGLSRLKSVDMRWNATQLPSLRCGPQCVMRNHILSKVSTKGRVFCVAWSPGGDQIASGSDDKTIIVWHAKTGEQVSTLTGHTERVTSAAWRPGGDQIASASVDKTIIIWDSKTGEQVSTLKGHENWVTSVAWRPGGDQIASGSADNKIIIWDAKTGEPVSTLKGHTHWVTSVAWRPERPGGDQLASASNDCKIIIWDAKTEEQVSTLNGHKRDANSVAWSAGGDQIASGSYDNTIIIWDAKTGEQISTLKGHSNYVTSVAWRPGGDQIASGSKDKTIIIWDAKTGEQISTLQGHSDYVRSVAWSPNGDQIASGSEDRTIIIWDAKSGKQILTCKGHSNYVRSVAWRPGGDQIVSGAGKMFKPGEVIIWDAKTGDKISELKGHTDKVTCVAWRPGGDQIVSGGLGAGGWRSPGEIIIWDAKTGDQVSTLKGHTDPVMSVAWRPGGDHIVSGGYGGHYVYESGDIMVWDANNGEQVRVLKGHTALVTSVAWHPGGDQIASASFDKTVIIWDARTWKQVAKLKEHDGPVMTVAWRPGGDQIASGSHCDTIIIWDANTGEQVSTLKGRTGTVISLAWRPVGDQIASASRDNMTIIIWDVRTKKRVSTLKGHTDDVNCVTWRPVGDQIASGSDDKTIIIWDAKTGEQISTLKGHAERVTSVAWRPGGYQIVSGSSDKTIIIWDAKIGKQVSALKGHTDSVRGVEGDPGARSQSRNEPNLHVRPESEVMASTLQTGPVKADQGVALQNNAAASEIERVCPAISLSCDDEFMGTEADSQPSPPKKKKTRGTQSQA